MPHLTALRSTHATSTQDTAKRVKYKSVPGVRRMRVLVGLGVLALLYFVCWFARPEHIGYAPFFWLLTVSLGFKLLRFVHEWYHYAQVREPAPLPWAADYRPTVDVLTTACPGEPHDMIVRTLRAMQAIRYPHTSYLCDEGNDPALRAACQHLGVVHVTRQVKVDAKAGNINNALRQATGELCVVLDPDHVPAPEFLDEVVPYFQNQRVGFVQVVQAYGNQQESLVARGAAEQTYHFYGPLMMGMNRYGTVQAIGANCTFRREALDSIGGHAAGLTEDMHTAMRLHAQGWQSVYVPKVLSRGLVPSTLAGFYAQQLKWARGAFDLLFRVYPQLFGRFTWAQRLHYLLLPLYFFSGVITLIDIAIPTLALLTTEFPWQVNLLEFVLHLLPLLTMGLLIRLYAQRWLREPHEIGLHVAGGLLRVSTWWVYALGWLYAVLGVRVPYIPTPKEGQVRNELLLSLPNLLLAVWLIATAKYGRTLSFTPETQFMSGLVLLNAAILLAGVGMAQHAVLNQLIRKVAASRLARTSLLTLDQALHHLTARLLPGLRAGAVPCAVLVLGLCGLGTLLRSSYHTYAVAQTGQRWPFTGGTELHLGQMSPVGQPTAQPTRYLTPSDTAAILSFSLPPAPLPYLLEPVRRAVVQSPAVALLSWPVTPAPGLWLPSAGLRQFQKLRHPLLLRPLLPAASPAAHRRAWRQLVLQFRAAGIRNVVWVWTPPRADQVAAYFPGEAYVDWIAAPGPEVPDMAATNWYTRFRACLAPHIELHTKPVLLLLDAPAAQLRHPARLRQHYPEVKALVFNSSPEVRPRISVASRYSAAVAPAWVE